MPPGLADDLASLIKEVRETNRLLGELWNQNDWLQQHLQEQANYPQQVQVVEKRRSRY